MLKADEVFYNQAKWDLKEGKKLIGAWLQCGSSVTAEIFGKAGFDCIMIDMEHSPIDMMTLVNQLQAMARFEPCALVRVPWNDFVTIKRVLDTGAHGILVPYVNTKEEAMMAVRACKYPPQGIRGIAPSPRAGGYGLDGLNYLDKANQETLVMTAVETPEAVANIEQIVQVEGLDGIFIGPMDLSTSMGHFCSPAEPEVQQSIARIEQAVFGSGKFLATVAGSIEQAKSLYDRGYALVIAMSDSVSLAKLAKETVSTFRTIYAR